MKILKIAIALVACAWSTLASAQSQDYLREIRDATTGTRQEISELRAQVDQLRQEIQGLRSLPRSQFIADALILREGGTTNEEALAAACRGIGYPAGKFTSPVTRPDSHHVVASVVCYGPR